MLQWGVVGIHRRTRRLYEKNWLVRGEDWMKSCESAAGSVGHYMLSWCILNLSPTVSFSTSFLIICCFSFSVQQWQNMMTSSSMRLIEERWAATRSQYCRPSFGPASSPLREQCRLLLRLCSLRPQEHQQHLWIPEHRSALYRHISSLSGSY